MTPMGRKGQQPYYGATEDTWVVQGSTTSINPWLVVGFAVMVFVVAIAALVIVVTRDKGDDKLVVDRSSTSTTAASSTSSVTAPPPTTITVTAPPPSVTTATAPPTLPPTTQSPYMGDSEALYQLQRVLDQDRGTAEQVVGYWVPQVSSKKIGLDVKNDDRGPYTAAMVLSDHLAYEARYEPEGADVILVRSDDFNFKVPGFVVTVIAEPFATPEAANNWCNERSIGVDDCFAKRLDHDGDWKGSVLSRK